MTTWRHAALELVKNRGRTTRTLADTRLPGRASIRPPALSRMEPSVHPGRRAAAGYGETGRSSFGA
jgi:hypothetical protein